MEKVDLTLLIQRHLEIDADSDYDDILANIIQQLEDEGWSVTVESEESLDEDYLDEDELDGII